MADDGDLRARLARLDPAALPAAAGRVDATSTEQIRERVMQTVETTPTATPTRLPRRRLVTVVAGAAVAVAGAATAAVLLGGDSTPKPSHPLTTMTLRAPGAPDGPATSNSCIVFDVSILRDMPVAFAGTVVEIGADTVTLDVDRWYKGGTADRVTVSNPTAGATVSVEGVEFTAGSRYLITATDGIVNVCGFSGPATPDLERAFGEAFGG